MNDLEAKVLDAWFELKDCNEIDRVFGFKPGWSESIMKELKQKYFSEGKENEVQKV